jgi:hypothetical protein
MTTRCLPPGARVMGCDSKWVRMHRRMFRRPEKSPEDRPAAVNRDTRVPRDVGGHRSAGFQHGRTHPVRRPDAAVPEAGAPGFHPLPITPANPPSIGIQLTAAGRPILSRRPMNRCGTTFRERPCAPFAGEGFATTDLIEKTSLKRRVARLIRRVNWAGREQRVRE